MKSSFIKKAASAAAAMAIALSSVITNASAEREILGYMGDVNHDNTVSVADLVALDGYLIGGGQLGEDCAYNADMNFDGRVNVGDLIILRSYLAGSRPVDVIYGEEITTTTTTAEVTTTTTATTTETTTTTTAEADFINAAVDDVAGYLPSQGTGNLVIFYVDFPDCRYSYDPTAEQVWEIAFGEEDTSDRNYPFDSMHAFYQRSSKGALDLEGKVFRYTAKNNQATYDNDKDALVKECYAAFDAEYDFSQFDGDNDGHIDATLLTVPTAAGDDAWWPCAGPSGLSDNYYVKYDGKMIGHLITGNAQIESATDYKNFNSSYLHEMGHCMGLPDYYLYTGTDTEGLHGIAGLELMDMDASTDFGAVSKYVLGWYRENQILTYDKSMGTKTFTLKNAQTDNGNCIIIPNSSDPNECFIVEYADNIGNNSNPMYKLKAGDGIRVYHADVTLYNNGWWTEFKYSSGADEFTNSNAGRRFIRLINDEGASYYTDNFYDVGSVISSSISGFNWYDGSGNQTVDPGITITVGDYSNDEYTVTISAK